MKALVFLFTGISLLIFTYFPYQQESKPKKQGVERWNIKILADEEAKEITWKPEIATISELANLPKEKVGPTTPRFGYEFNVYSVTCRIGRVILEEDGDMHIVLIDTTTKETMVAESASSDQNSPYKAKFREVRDSLGKYIEKKGAKMYGKAGIYQITGVGFFDKKHKVTGASSNFFELHPVLSITKIK